jgi:dihydrofolate reductase
MGQIINSTFISLDGVINHMEAWHFAYTDDEAAEIAAEQLLATDALLMGRKTYEGYAAIWPQREGAYPDKINTMQKYVVSATIDQPGWANTTVISGDLVEQVTGLKQRGGDIMMHGFGPVARTLVKNGLLDVLHLWVHPHFAGVGNISDMLFSEGLNTRLELISPRTLNSGVVILSYQVPDGRPASSAAQA